MRQLLRLRLDLFTFLFVICTSLPSFSAALYTYTTLFRSNGASQLFLDVLGDQGWHARSAVGMAQLPLGASVEVEAILKARDRKSTRLNSSHLVISYAVFCLKKKNNIDQYWKLKIMCSHEL